jgi:hypothetical protein
MINPRRQKVNIQLPRAVRVFVEQNKNQQNQPIVTPQVLRRQANPEYVPPSVIRLDPKTRQPVTKAIEQANESRVQLFNASRAGIKSPSRPTPQQVNRRRGPVIQYSSDKDLPVQAAFINRLKSVGVGRALVIIGNGPSISTVNLGDLKDKKQIDICSINNPDMRVWPTQYWSFFDSSQYRRHKGLLADFKGVLLTGSSIESCHPNHLRLRNLGLQTFSQDLMKGLAIGRSSVFAALQVAEWMKYDEIYVFGVDMDAKGIDGKLHFYGTNPDVPPHVRVERFKAEADCFMLAVDNLSEERRKSIHFCSEYNTWPFVKHFGSHSASEGLDLVLNKWGTPIQASNEFENK